MKRIRHFFAALTVAVTCSNPLFAVSSLEVNISLTIPASLDVVWYGDANGVTGGFAAAEFASEVAWPIGTAALSGTYETFTPTVGGGGSCTFLTGYPLLIRNKSNTNVSVDAVMVATNAGTTASTTTVWAGSSDGSVTANGFNLKVSIGAANAAAIDGGQSLAWATPTGTATTGLIASLANGADSGRVDFQLKTPSSITVGGGTAQRMIVRFTATAIP